jgi:hypothetical protein
MGVKLHRLPGDEDDTDDDADGDATSRAAGGTTLSSSLVVSTVDIVSSTAWRLQLGGSVAPRRAPVPPHTPCRRAWRIALATSSNALCIFVS